MSVRTNASNAVVVPPPADLYPTLCKVTERLARELADPTSCAPDWSAFEWVMARAVAALHGISPLLSRSLQWQGPGSWTRFLEEQRVHTAARYLQIQALLGSIDQKACEAGVAGTALKGAALHEMGLYAAGDRPMADIDLLVRPADADRMAALLVTLGYRQSGETWKERIFNHVDERAPAAFGEHSNNSLKIELHEGIREKLPWRMTDASEFIFPLQPRPGLNGYPSNGSLMRHLLLHAAGSMVFQSLRILHLHDIALLSTRMSESDWNELTTLHPPDARMWWAFPPLALVSRYYPSRVPRHVLAALSKACSFVLRVIVARKSLIDVSYSYLWIKAFPGIEWSQSIPECVAYAASRVRPNAEHMAQREYVATNQTWAKQGDWSRMSQGRRILRWLASRQTRPTVMHTISAAFAHVE
jgi:hypothetical protein